MPSEVDLAKRELVRVLRELAAKYRIVLALSRESSKKEVETAFRRVSVKAHPDKGGHAGAFRLRSTTLCGLWHSDGNDVGPIARSFDQEAAAVRARARSSYLQTTRNKPRRPRRC